LNESEPLINCQKNESGTENLAVMEWVFKRFLEKTFDQLKDAKKRWPSDHLYKVHF